MTRGALSPIASISRAASLAASSGRQRMTTSTDPVKPLLGFRVLARLGGQARQFDACDARKLVADLQAGCSRLAVDEDCRHDRRSEPQKTSCARGRTLRVRISVGAVGQAGGGTWAALSAKHASRSSDCPPRRLLKPGLRSRRRVFSASRRSQGEVGREFHDPSKPYSPGAQSQHRPLGFRDRPRIPVQRHGLLAAPSGTAPALGSGDERRHAGRRRGDGLGVRSSRGGGNIAGGARRLAGSTHSAEEADQGAWRRLLCDRAAGRP